MSGYLQRLSTSVIDPGRSIRPAIAPIFSAEPSSEIPRTGIQERFVEDPVQAAARPWPAVERDDRTFVAPPPAFARRDGPLHETGAEPFPADAFDSPAGSLNRPFASTSSRSRIEAAEEPSVFRPLVNAGILIATVAPAQIRPQPADVQASRQPEAARSPNLYEPQPDMSAVSPSRRQPASPAYTASFQPRSDAPREAAQQAASAPLPPRTQANEPAQTDSRDGYEPLIADPPNRAQTPSTPPNAPQPAAPSWRGDWLGRVPARAPLPEREPDEIQIHIGRIEVTAAPPPPARPAPKPTRKTASLDDYLKRRHGRA